MNESVVATQLHQVQKCDLSLAGLSLEEVAGLCMSQGQLSKVAPPQLPNLRLNFDPELTSYAEWKAHVTRVKEAILQMETSLAAVDKNFDLF